ncbi:diacylglycerol lipase-beta isoform X1 [Stegostoma tigrinum]|uniref:diacylglycerol lipase-beta isoform X1 n=1 Tax=Stegostoma tigrinum TaxID=3053191 RepID=UPI00202B2BD1|nr:diacylglycerol lipase-beta isoform X1 [Stegostoma tigrinum]
MPGLVVFGRRWSLASDDLVFPGAFELLLRVLWFIGILTLYLTHRGQFNCKGGGFLPSYLVVLIVILAAIILVLSIIVYVSMQGTITKPGPRQHIPALIYIRTTLYIPELVWAFLGAVWVNDESQGCAPSVVATITIAVIASWVFLFFTVVAVLIFFDPLGRARHLNYLASTARDLESSDSVQAKSMASRVWECRLKLMCCCVTKDTKDNRAAFTDIAELFSAFFLDTDLVPGDIAAGLTLLHQEQDKKEKWSDLEEVACTLPQPQSAEELDIELENSAHYMQFAVAAYGWPLYIFSNPLTGICRLSHNCMCCRSQFPEQDIVGGDHVGCHFTSMLQTTGLQNRDFIYISFHNKIYEIPFYVALDHKKEAVVVAVRGTLSLEDALTDLSADRETLNVDCVTGESLAHKGIIQAARYIYKKLIDDEILTQAFSVVPEYKLVITGHSLGAGAASILAIMLHASFPALRCYAFSPPGGLLSKPLADHSKEFIISIVLGKDLIPRLSLCNMGDLKRRILRIVAQSNRPKYQILLRGCWYEIFGGDPANFSDHLDNSQQGRLTEPLLAEQNLMGHQSSSYSSIPDESPSSSPFQGPQLFLPGRIIYIVEKYSTGSFCFSEAKYCALWCDASFFSNILISPKMITDHMPDLVFKVLKDLTQEAPYILCSTSPTAPSEAC